MDVSKISDKYFWQDTSYHQIVFAKTKGLILGWQRVLLVSQVQIKLDVLEKKFPISKKVQILIHNVLTIIEYDLFPSFHKLHDTSY